MARACARAPLPGAPGPIPSDTFPAAPNAGSRPAVNASTTLLCTDTCAAGAPAPATQPGMAIIKNPTSVLTVRFVNTANLQIEPVDTPPRSSLQQSWRPDLFETPLSTWLKITTEVGRLESEVSLINKPETP